MIATMDAVADRAVPVDLAELHRAHYGALVRLARALVDDWGSAEEVVQEAFVRVLVARERLRGVDAALPYLRTAVVNLARSGLRRRAVARRHAPALAVAAVAPVLTNDQRDVIGALQALSRRQRECVVLRYWLDLSEAEIASTLDISTGAVKTHTHRGMAALEARLTEVDE